MNAKETKRIETFLPGGEPKKIRIYDNPKFADRYTVVFTGNYRAIGLSRGQRPTMWHQSLGMSHNPYHPQGVGCHNEYESIIDYPTYGHLGKKIKFSALPENCQDMVLDAYIGLWNLAPDIIEEGFDSDLRNNPYPAGTLEFHAWNNGRQRK